MSIGDDIAQLIYATAMRPLLAARAFQSREETFSSFFLGHFEVRYSASRNFLATFFEKVAKKLERLKRKRAGF